MTTSRLPLFALAAPLLLLPLSACGETQANGVSDDERWTRAELEAVTAVIQAEIEELRGERFERKVEVEITNREGFIAHATERMEQLTSAEELSAEEQSAKLLGLIPPDMDLWATTFKVLEDQVGGFYDPGADTFYLMESFTGAVAKIILAHELTHALDDQLYDIDGTLTQVLANRDAAAAYQAVVEGSGTAMMTQWMMKFSEPLTAAEAAAAASMGTESLSEAPAYIWKPLLAAYTAGNTFLDRGYRLKKRQAKQSKDEGATTPTFSDVIRIAFQSPPRSTEQILHPTKYWDEEELDEPVSIELEATLAGEWKLLNETTLGELSMALLTDDSGPVDFSNPMALAFLKYTNTAATGWGGDRMILCGAGEARFLHVASAWDSVEDAAEFRAALEQRLEAWQADVAQLGEGGGVTLMSADEAHPERVRFSAWYGMTAEEAASLAAGVSLK